MKINYDFYKHKENIPIKEVAKLLGLNMTRDGKCICPCHADTRPSMFITENGRYENRWHCFVDGEGGDPLNLTMAVQFGIAPSTYFSNPNAYKKEREQAAKFLDEHFPGAIIEEKENDSNQKNALPTFSYKFLKEIGLDSNPFLPKYLKPYSPNNFTKNEFKEIEPKNEAVTIDALDTLEAIYLIKEKIEEYLDNLFPNMNKFFKENFPEMPIEGRTYINKIISDKYDYASGILQQIDSYLIIHDPEFNKELSVSCEETLEEIEQYMSQQDIERD